MATRKNKTKQEEPEMLSQYDMDSMWMSYRYCIGRQSIAAHSRAQDIANYCYGKMSAERSVFTAYDINKEIEDCLRVSNNISFWFPTSSYNRVYFSAIDVYCEFIEDFGITTYEELLKYKDVHVEFDQNNPKGYSVRVDLWSDWYNKKLEELNNKYAVTDTTSELPKEYYKELDKIKLSLPKKEYFSMYSIECLFVWNDLCHLFDLEHHHKSILIDGTECEWFWTWRVDYRQNDDGLKQEIAYKKVRVPIDRRSSLESVYLPDESIKEDLY